MDLKLLKGDQNWINVISRIQIQSGSKVNNKFFESFLHGTNMPLNGDLK